MVKRCFIENDPSIGAMVNSLVIKHRRARPKNFFDVIILEASKNMHDVIRCISECDEIYVDTVYDTIGGDVRGPSSLMLDKLMKMSIDEGWKNKRVINFKPRGQMKYTVEQQSVMPHLFHSGIVKFEYMLEILLAEARAERDAKEQSASQEEDKKIESLLASLT